MVVPQCQMSVGQAGPCLGKLVEIVDGLADLGSYDELASGMLSGDDVARFLREGHE